MHETTSNIKGGTPDVSAATGLPSGAPHFSSKYRIHRAAFRTSGAGPHGQRLPTYTARADDGLVRLRLGNAGATGPEVTGSGGAGAAASEDSAAREGASGAIAGTAATGVVATREGSSASATVAGGYPATAAPCCPRPASMLSDSTEATCVGGSIGRSTVTLSLPEPQTSGLALSLGTARWGNLDGVAELGRLLAASGREGARTPGWAPGGLRDTAADEAGVRRTCRQPCTSEPF
mmetsp:Transcript_90739/g.292911  ORF Transcript_90739/g.292911 Transcript_90739/m.292911 type:complete len:235 (+) Transcript_90739:870-1574(+)